ncbi:MAG TPA: hypothetical protein VIU41_15205 [Geobacteraceae bacterium]
MKIKVLYHDNRAGLVHDYLLDELLKNGTVLAFHRAGGWVTVGRDQVRQCQVEYVGPERRRRGVISTFFG